MQLNPKQEEARNKIEGPLLIIAGAGSGKTATLTKRTQYMIKEKGIDPNTILMVTFTNKAAKEMRERVAKTLGINPPRSIYYRNNFPLIGTFHSIGIYILKEVLNNFTGDELGIGIKKDFVIYDEADKISVLKNILKNKLNIEEKEFPARQIAFYISNAKNSLVTAKAYESEVDSSIKEVVYKTYLQYEIDLIQNNAMDFDDILVKTLALLKIPKILSIYWKKYKYLMIDEYQDTNAPQYQIIKLLASKHKNLAVVGDDSQSIYSWRGADMTNIINFRKDYPDALIVKLEQNYRSTKNIISGANAVIGNNTFGIKKELWTDNGLGDKISYIEAPDDKAEASIIASIIKEEPDNLSKNLILYRTNAQSRQLEEALMMKSIAYRVVGGLKFYDRKEIKDILAYLRIIHNSLDQVSMKRIINIPPRKIGVKSVEILTNYKENYNLPYLQIIENVDEIEELKPMARNSIKTFGSIYVSLLKASNEIVISDLIKQVVKKISYNDYITSGLTQEEKQTKLDNIDELINVASEYNGMEPRVSLEHFLEDVSLIIDMNTKDENEDFVTLMTIHTSKGLEEKRVFLTGLEDGIFPGFRSVNDSNALEEERRLMYVAMTRAEETLFISRAKERFHFGDYVRNPESRFLKEIPLEYIQNHDLSSFVKKSTNFFESSNSSSTSFDTKPTYQKVIKNQTNNDVSQFKVGDKLQHPKFGIGLLVSLNGEIGEIAFSGKQIKKMNIKIAPVRKI